MQVGSPLVLKFKKSPIFIGKFANKDAPCTSIEQPSGSEWLGAHTGAGGGSCWQHVRQRTNPRFPSLPQLSLSGNDTFPHFPAAARESSGLLPPYPMAVSKGYTICCMLSSIN